MNVERYAKLNLTIEEFKRLEDAEDDELTIVGE